MNCREDFHSSAEPPGPSTFERQTNKHHYFIIFTVCNTSNLVDRTKDQKRMFSHLPPAHSLASSHTALMALVRTGTVEPTACSVRRISVFPSPLSCVRPVFVSHTFIYLKCDRAVSFTIIHLTCKRNCISSVHDIAVVILADSTKRIMRCTK